jgi:hypothetical protein
MGQPPKVVQFRDSALESCSNEPSAVGRYFVSKCVFRSMLADMYVYEMDLIPRVGILEARHQLLAPIMSQSNCSRSLRGYTSSNLAGSINQNILLGVD